jgi:hypothetical protein
LAQPRRSHGGLLRGTFVFEHNLEYQAVAGHIIICGQIACLGDIIITVDKLLAVLDPEAAPLDARVETIVYAYNASVNGYSSFLRNDNCHPYHGHGDDHHRHRMSWKSGAELPGSPEWVGEEHWPHLSEFIDHVHKWYSETMLSCPPPIRIRGWALL